MVVMAQLDALLTNAAFAPLSDIGWLRVTGADRVRWLNGMVTNSIQGLTSGEGNYNFLLNAQGRIEGDLTAWMLDDAILLESTQPDAVAAHLERFIIMDDVELTPVPDLAGLLLAGPHALPILQALGGSPNAAALCLQPVQPVSNEPLHLKQTMFDGAPVYLIRAYSPLVPRFEIWSSFSTVASILRELHNTDALPASEMDLEQLRILEGTPRYGVDIRNVGSYRDLPQETGQARALHFSKGCYLGQEIVERIRSRGQVHRTFTGFLLTGDLPSPGTLLTADPGPEAKPVGEITSVAAIKHPAQELIQIALGYLRRDALSRPNPLHYVGGMANPITLPYKPGQK
jgi:folate-binding protein YgfZ